MLSNHNNFNNLQIINIKALVTFSIIILLSSHIAFPQSGTKIKRIRKVSIPEKMWTLTHPFIAGKAISITKLVLSATDSIKKSPLLDGDADGGQVDAFRHGFWMASLSYAFGQRKALSLGKAHEKADYLEFKKKFKKGIISAHDSISTAMDLFNNKAGAEIGAYFSKTGNNKRLCDTIINAILSGNLMIIRKNKQNSNIDCNGNIINPDLIALKWNTPRCLVPSNTIRPD